MALVVALLGVTSSLGQIAFAQAEDLAAFEAALRDAPREATRALQPPGMGLTALGLRWTLYEQEPVASDSAARAFDTVTATVEDLGLTEWRPAAWLLVQRSQRALQDGHTAVGRLQLARAEALAPGDPTVAGLRAAYAWRDASAAPGPAVRATANAWRTLWRTRAGRDALVAHIMTLVPTMALGLLALLLLGLAVHTLPLVGAAVAARFAGTITAPQATLVLVLTAVALGLWTGEPLAALAVLCAWIAPWLVWSARSALLLAWALVVGALLVTASPDPFIGEELALRAAAAGPCDARCDARLAERDDAGALLVRAWVAWRSGTPSDRRRAAELLDSAHTEPPVDATALPPGWSEDSDVGASYLALRGHLAFVEGNLEVADQLYSAALRLAPSRAIDGRLSLQQWRLALARGDSEYAEASLARSQMLVGDLAHRWAARETRSQNLILLPVLPTFDAPRPLRQILVVDSPLALPPWLIGMLAWLVAWGLLPVRSRLRTRCSRCDTPTHAAAEPKTGARTCGDCVELASAPSRLPYQERTQRESRQARRARRERWLPLTAPMTGGLLGVTVGGGLTMLPALAALAVGLTLLLSPEAAPWSCWMLHDLDDAAGRIPSGLAMFAVAVLLALPGALLPRRFR